jgi:hypothetical protein
MAFKLTFKGQGKVNQISREIRSRARSQGTMSLNWKKA